MWEIEVALASRHEDILEPHRAGDPPAIRFDILLFLRIEKLEPRRKLKLRRVEDMEVSGAGDRDDVTERLVGLQIVAAYLRGDGKIADQTVETRRSAGRQGLYLYLQRSTDDLHLFAVGEDPPEIASGHDRTVEFHRFDGFFAAAQREDCVLGENDGVVLFAVYGFALVLQAFRPI